MGVTGSENGYAWKDIEQGMINGIALSLGAILILLSVGSLIGTWLLSALYLRSFTMDKIAQSHSFLCCLCSYMYFCSHECWGSWTTASTVGVALIGIASGMGMSEVIAGPLYPVPILAIRFTII